MPLPKQKLIIFDLDGTLAESKQPMDEEMSLLFIRLLRERHISVISGGGWKQFETQFLRSMPTITTNFTTLYLLPTSGTRLYIWRGDWHEQYAEELSVTEKKKIMDALNSALKASGFMQPEKLFGAQIEDRGSQITFSALGQQAPFEYKAKWDPDRSKREKIAELIRKKIPEFDVRVGGSTSVDITKRGINKGYGIRKLEGYLKLSPDQIIFVGDALFYGGNDYPARATGVDCIPVTGPSETKKLIKGWLE